MKTILRSIAHAKRRIYLQNVISALGTLIAVGLMVALGLLCIDRLLAIPVSIRLYAVIGAVAAVGPFLWARLRLPDDAATAEAIDRRMKLKDQVATALFAADIKDDPFARRVVEDARKTASGLKLASGFPLRWTRVWAYVPPAAAVLAVLVVFLPQMDLLGIATARQQRNRQQQKTQQAQEHIVEAAALIEQIQVTQPTTDGHSLDELHPDQALRELAQITKQDLSNPRLRDEAAAKLSQAQQALAQKSHNQQQQLDQLQNALSRLDPETPGPGDAFADALRRGDFEAAQEAIQELASKVESIDDHDRQALQDQLEDLASQLQQIAQQQAQNSQEANQQAQKMLSDAGLSPQQVQQLQQQGMPPEAIQQQLQQQGMPSQQAQQLANQVQQLQQQQGRHRNTSQQTNQLSSALNQMSQTAPHTPGQQPPGQQGQSPPSSSFQQAAGGADQSLNQMAQMREQLNQMRRAQSQTQQAIQQLSQGQQPAGGSQGMQSLQNGNGSGQNPMPMSQQPGSGQGQQGHRQGGSPHQQAGTGEGGDPMGQHRRTGPYQTRAESDIQDGQGRVIASWLGQADMGKGQPGVEFDQAITEAQQDAEQAVTEDRVPRRYHESIRQYFNQLPQTAQQAKSAPPAPR